jgi:hypothetical protein
MVPTTKEQYERDLIEKQRQHLNSIQDKLNVNWRPCMHDACPSCIGTGIKIDGSPCVHMISCPCPKCSPTY